MDTTVAIPKRDEVQIKMNNQSKVSCQCPWRCECRPSVLRGQTYLNTKSTLFIRPLKILAQHPLS